MIKTTNKTTIIWPQNRIDGNLNISLFQSLHRSGDTSCLTPLNTFMISLSGLVIKIQRHFTNHHHIVIIHD